MSDTPKLSTDVSPVLVEFIDDDVSPYVRPMLVGYQGPRGLQGEVGPQGPSGSMGQMGEQGLRGEQGPPVDTTNLTTDGGFF